MPQAATSEVPHYAIFAPSNEKEVFLISKGKKRAEIVIQFRQDGKTGSLTCHLRRIDGEWRNIYNQGYAL